MSATSVLLTGAFDVDVVDADLWVDPASATAVFVGAEVADRVEAVGAAAFAGSESLFTSYPAPYGDACGALGGGDGDGSSH